jgi:hypothetical protein
MPQRRNRKRRRFQRARAGRSASSRSKPKVEAGRVLTIFRSVSKATFWPKTSERNHPSNEQKSRPRAASSCSMKRPINRRGRPACGRSR